MCALGGNRTMGSVRPHDFPIVLLCICFRDGACPIARPGCRVCRALHHQRFVASRIRNSRHCADKTAEHQKMTVASG